MRIHLPLHCGGASCCPIHFILHEGWTQLVWMMKVHSSTWPYGGKGPIHFILHGEGKGWIHTLWVPGDGSGTHFAWGRD